jgi:hypothetical protein
MYYRFSVFIPFINNSLPQLHHRILSHRRLLESLQYLLPQHCISIDEEKTKNISDNLTNFCILMQKAIGEAYKLSYLCGGESAYSQKT